MEININRRLLILIFILTWSFVAIACKLATPPTVTETVQIGSTDIPTQEFTPTEPAPTSTPRPSPTATIEPTPTPEGFYINGPGGFSLLIPPAWDLEEEASSYVVLGDDYSTFYMESRAADSASTLDDFVEEWAAILFEDLTYEKGEPFEVTVGEGLQAQAVDLTTHVPNGPTYVVRFATLNKNGRDYRIFLITDRAILKNTLKRFDDVLASVEFFAPSFYGLDKSETYTEYGWDPIDAEDLDPAMSTSGSGGYPGLVFAGLVKLSPELQVIPDLAEDLTISSDGTVYTFKLRDGLQFADGRPITAQDFKDSWERALDPDTDSSVALTYLGDILGAREKNAGTADDIAGVKVIDDRILEVTLDGPKPYFLAKLTYPTSYVVDGAQANAGGDWYYEPNASGPYKIKEYKPDDYIIFERNDAYWNPPAIRNVLYLFNPGGSLLSLYEEGMLDMVPIWGDDVARIRNVDDPLHAEWQSTTSMCTEMLLFNNSTPPFDDLNVRKAFALSVDKDSLVWRMTGGTDFVTYSILPPAMPGFRESVQGPFFNVDKARAALKSSRYGTDLPEVKLSVAGYGDSENSMVNGLVSMWKESLGVDVTVEYIDPTRMNEAARERANPMTFYGWCADYPDPENFLDVLFHTDSEFNASGYSNPDIDALLEEARVEQDDAKRIALYQLIEAKLITDVAAVPLMRSESNVLVKPRVQGFKLMPMNGSYIPFLSLQK